MDDHAVGEGKREGEQVIDDGGEYGPDGAGFSPALWPNGMMGLRFCGAPICAALPHLVCLPSHLCGGRRSNIHTNLNIHAMDNI